ncbi:MAG TPA: N-formylglutamate amidohydrolase [Gemmatimonadaceae bacterium]|nr:N-formylglutamate amidohydrolase [Gemmatimonadaceae bacterium]
MTAPFEIVRPFVSTPVVYDSPHSGRFYPSDFSSNALPLELRRGEDAYVDELLTGAPACGVTVLAATYPRCYIDLNRELTDIDPALLAEPWPEPLAPTEKSARGLGLIRRYVTPGVEAQARPQTVGEVQARIDRVYRPYHAVLDALVAETHARHGFVLHVDWHSMKSVGNAMTPDGVGARRADFVVSDVHGRSASTRVTELVVETIRSFGYTASVNVPYAGGAIVQRLGRPWAGVHSVQVEVNRSLYLDELSSCKTSEFCKLASRLDSLARDLVLAALAGFLR